MNKESITLSASPRADKESPKVVRRNNEVPGVIYGGKTKNTAVKCNLKELHAVYVKAGENTLVQVELEGKKIPCLIHAVSFEPVSGREEHVDFYAVDMTKKVTTHVPVVFTGESPAVKSLGGVLVTVHDQVEVTCLPSDIPKNFTIDLSKLENFRDTVAVSALVIPSGVTLKTSPETIIITVQEPRKEEVIEVVAPVAEGAEGAEGAAAAPGAEGAAAAPGAPAAKADDKGGAKDAKPAKK